MIPRILRAADNSKRRKKWKRTAGTKRANLQILVSADPPLISAHRLDLVCVSICGTSPRCGRQDRSDAGLDETANEEPRLIRTYDFTKSAIKRRYPSWHSARLLGKVVSIYTMANLRQMVKPSPSMSAPYSRGVVTIRSEQHPRPASNPYAKRLC